MRYPLFLATIITFSGCSKDDPTGDTSDCNPNGTFADLDGDGFGDPEAPLCGDLLGVENDLDCDDSQASVNPDATETCASTADDNCDGSTNDVDALDCTVYYGDGDGDGYAGEELSACICEPDPTYNSLSYDDCDDSLASVNPEAIEDCATAWDDNCDGDVNPRNAENCIEFYEDVDGDGYGNTISACFCSPTSIYTTPDGGDCDDTRANTYPGAPELCNGLQEDCAIDPWSALDEDGQVSFESSAGGWRDVTPDFNVFYAVPESGTLHLCPGEYSVGIEVDTQGTVFLTGHDRGDADPVVITSSTTSALTVVDSQVTVSGVQLQGSQASSSSTGGAISVDGSGLTLSGSDYHLKLRDTVLEDSSAGFGGALHAVSARVYIGETTIESNSATSGGAIYLDGSSLLADQVDFVSNEATNGQGGAIYAHNSSDVSLEECSVEGNQASAEGGGVYLDSSPLEMRDTAVHLNQSGAMGAGVYTFRSDINCTASLSSYEAGIFNNRETPNAQAPTGVGLFAKAAASSIPVLTIYAWNCDLGSATSNAQPDNSPDDIVFNTMLGYTYTKNYENNASFTCTMQGDLVKCQ